MNSAIRFIDTLHPWVTPPTYPGTTLPPSTGSLKVSDPVVREAPQYSSYQVTIRAFFPLRPAQFCAYQRYLETLAEKVVARPNLRGVKSARVCLKMSGCYGEKFERPATPPLPIMQRLRIGGSVEFMGKVYTTPKK